MMVAARVVWALLVILVAACKEPPTPIEQGYPVTAAWARVRQSPGHMSHLVHVSLACRECHKIEDADGGFGQPPLTLCDDCHETQRDAIHQSVPALAATPRCQSCHVFDRAAVPDVQLKHAAASTNADACMRCHQDTQGLGTTIEVHRTVNCSACHQPHANDDVTMTRGDCQTCHDTIDAPHGRGRQTVAGCAACHAPHEAGVAASATCAPCHARGSPAVSKAALRVGHARCTTCHVPHEFTKSQVKACVACHKQPVLAPQKHAACTTCHDPHDAKARPACTDCHRERVTHPQTATTPCADCHPAHELASGQIAVTCEKCHMTLAPHGDATCRDCHAPHAGRPTLTRTECGRCHQQIAQTSGGTGHANCATCHVTPGHKAATPVPSCLSCHKKQGAAAAHDDCQGCHRTGAEASHQPRLTMPACTSCHSGNLPALHRINAHQRCESCHVGTHQLRLTVGRAACSTCHTTLADHEPNATSCVGCHPFAGVLGP